MSRKKSLRKKWFRVPILNWILSLGKTIRENWSVFSESTLSVASTMVTLLLQVFTQRDKKLDVENEELQESENLVRISKREGERAAILTAGEDSKISFSAAELNFPDCKSLRYRKNGEEFIVLTDDVGYCPPEGGWGDRTYYFEHGYNKWWKIFIEQEHYIFGGLSLGMTFTILLFEIILYTPSRFLDCFVRGYEFPAKNCSDSPARNSSGIS